MQCPALQGWSVLGEDLQLRFVDCATKGVSCYITYHLWTHEEAFPLEALCLYPLRLCLFVSLYLENYHWNPVALNFSLWQCLRPYKAIVQTKFKMGGGGVMSTFNQCSKSRRKKPRQMHLSQLVSLWDAFVGLKTWGCWLCMDKRVIQKTPRSTCNTLEDNLIILLGKHIQACSLHPA